MIQDFGEYGNGGATSIPRNIISTCISPMNYALESSVAGERVFAIMNHELVHITALDNASKSDILEYANLLWDTSFSEQDWADAACVALWYKNQLEGENI